MMKSTIKEIER